MLPVPFLYTEKAQMITKRNNHVLPLMPESHQDNVMNFKISSKLIHEAEPLKVYFTGQLLFMFSLWSACFFPFIWSMGIPGV